MENNLDKSDEADAKVLSMIPPKFFREVTVKDIEKDTLIWTFIKLSKRIKVLKNWSKDGICVEGFEKLMKELQREKKSVERRIIEVARNSSEVYRRSLEELRIGDSVSLAILTLKLPLHMGRDKLKKYLGFTPQARETGAYNHLMRDMLSRAADAVYKNYHKHQLNKRGGIYQYINGQQNKWNALYEL